MKQLSHRGLADMGVGGGSKAPPWILEFLAKKVVFLILSGKKNFTAFGYPLEKNWKNPLVVPLGKNPSDAHVSGHSSAPSKLTWLTIFSGDLEVVQVSASRVVVLDLF